MIIPNSFVPNLSVPAVCRSYTCSEVRGCWRGSLSMVQACNKPESATIIGPGMAGASSAKWVPGSQVLAEPECMFARFQLLFFPRFSLPFQFKQSTITPQSLGDKTIQRSEFSQNVLRSCLPRVL